MPEKDLKLARFITGQWMDYILSPQNTSSFAFNAIKDPCTIARDPAVLGQSKEVWLACRTDGQPGLGTESDPFDVSTAEIFNTKMAEFCNQGAGGHIVIHLRPGTYMTNGGVYLATGTQIIGAGVGRTVIKLSHFNDADPNPETVLGANLKLIFDTYVAYIPQPEGLKHLLIADLSIDCDAPNQGNGWYFQAIRLKGNYCRVSNVEILNLGNRNQGAENFPVSIGNPNPNAPLYGAIIEGIIYDGTMTVPSTGGTSQTTFCLITNRNFETTPTVESKLGCYQCVIRDCRLVLAADQSDLALSQALNIADSRGSVIENNFISGFNLGVHQDSYGLKGLIIRNNVFRDVHSGIYLSNSCHRGVGADYDQHWQNILVEGNYIEMRKTTNPGDWDWGGIMFYNSTPESVNHTTKYVVIRNNFIQLLGEPDASAVNRGIVTAGRPDNLLGTDYFTVENNIISLAAPIIRILYDYIAHYSCWGNRSKEGVLVQAYEVQTQTYLDKLNVTRVSAEQASATSLFARGLLVPDAAVVDVSSGGTKLTFPEAGNLIYIVDNGSGNNVQIETVEGVRPGAEYIIINARSSATPSFQIVGGSLTIFGATQTLPSPEAAPGAIKVIGITPIKIRIL